VPRGSIIVNNESVVSAVRNGNGCQACLVDCPSRLPAATAILHAKTNRTPISVDTKLKLWSTRTLGPL
jgi:hypothetical protein